MKIEWIITIFLLIITITLISINSKFALMLNHEEMQNKNINILNIETDLLLKSNVLLLKNLQSNYQIQIELSEEYHKEYLEMENKNDRKRK